VAIGIVTTAFRRADSDKADSTEGVLRSEIPTSRPGPLSLMQLAPELLGDGVRLFGVPTLRASLTTLDVSASGQVVNLRLRVDKAVA
jgi:hypothetical protein